MTTRVTATALRAVGTSTVADVVAAMDVAARLAATGVRAAGDPSRVVSTVTKEPRP